jgi:hypothetical protein
VSVTPENWDLAHISDTGPGACSVLPPVWLDRPAWMMIGMFAQELKGPLVDQQLFTPADQPFARRQPTLQKMQFYAPPTYRAEGIVSVH